MMPSIPYPLKFAASRSQNMQRQRWRRLTGRRYDPQSDRWATVRLRKEDGLWFLVYNDETEGTGGFATIQDAVSWYATGGR